MSHMTPELVWGLFVRGLGVVYLISFASLAVQLPGRVPEGMSIARRFERIAEDFPTWRRYLYFPSLLWLRPEESSLRWLVGLGLVSAALVVYGGPWSTWALAVCYVSYLSLDLVYALVLPWDCMLLEATVLGLFLPATLPLPQLAAAAAPAPALAWAYRFLLFRVMFGFGKQKFFGATRKDWAYLKGFLIWQPMPTPLAWYAQKLPTWALKPPVVFMFVVEVPLAFFVFFPGWPSLVAAVGIAVLMVGIQAMGSYGFFSLLTIVVCIPLLDHATPAQLDLASYFSWSPELGVNVFVAVHTLFALMALAFNSWVDRTWTKWSFWYRLPRILQAPFALLRFMYPFRWLHPYGVFPPNTFPGVKTMPVVEVTWDRETWHAARYRHAVSHSDSAPKFVSPHHPRADQALIYEAFGLGPTSLGSSILGVWDPYNYAGPPPAAVILQRILEGEGPHILAPELFERYATPPVAARVKTVLLEPVSLAEHRESGAWWTQRVIGPHAPAQEHDPHFWDDFFADPELWHFEEIMWRRRSRIQPLMDRARAGEDPDALCLEGARDVDAADIDLFWEDFVPAATSRGRTRLDDVAPLRDELRARYDRRQWMAMQRLLGRYALWLVAKLEPLFHPPGRPKLPVHNEFELFMLAHHVIGLGRAVYRQAMADPPSVAAHQPQLTTHSGLFLLAFFRFDALVFDAQKLRLLEAIAPPYDKPLFGAEPRNALERFAHTLGQALAGFYGVIPELMNSFRGPPFDGGIPERYPSFAQTETGEVVFTDHGGGEPFRDGFSGRVRDDGRPGSP